MQANKKKAVVKKYIPLPTFRSFHASAAQMRAVVGPVGSGKTTAATWEVCHFLPFFLATQYKIKKTRWAVVRNTMSELKDTTQKTLFEWFDWGSYREQGKEGNYTYILKYPQLGGIEVEILFRSCDIEKHVRQFKSLELTGYWIDESIEVKEAVKRMLKNRIGRYPRKCPVRFGIETTNPPDVEHPLYSQFKWDTPPPGPLSKGEPLKKHAGFWQPPRENEENLRAGYYDDLINDYKDNPDWIAMYVEGKPGVMQTGKLVYNNFKRDHHVARETLIWSTKELIRGWDNTGNCPAAIVLQVPTAGTMHVLKEFHTEREGIVDFTERVNTECNLLFPDATYTDYADPAGNAEFSKKEGGFTSNARLMNEACGISVIPSEQNFTARTQAVEKQLLKIDGLLIDPACIRLINGFLGGYCYAEVGNTGIYAKEPIKNKFSHVHDALQYALVKLLSGQSKTMTTEEIKRLEAKWRFPT